MPNVQHDLIEADTPPCLSCPENGESAQVGNWRQQFQGDGAIDVSVCIVNWNCREHLRQCLESLHRQAQGVRLETIVVDNASTDGAADMVAQEFPEVQLVRNDDNVGFSRGNNQAARRARGEFVFFLNNDTLVPPGTLAKLVAYLQGHPEVSLVGPLLRDGTGKVQTSFRQRPTVSVWLHRTWLLRWTGLFRGAYRRYRRQTFDPTQGQATEVLMGAAMLLRRATFQTMGGWDEDFHFGGEDLEICLRAQQLGQIMYLPTVEISHFGRASTRQHIAFASPKIAIGFVKYLRKSGTSRLGILVYKLAITLDTPLQIIIKTAQYAWRRLRGKQEGAAKSWNGLQGLVAFLTRGLVGFWRA
jgi:N-acetylglucosaminyl-diphospho-decaprenol L-rhamnosyltransferase